MGIDDDRVEKVDVTDEQTREMIALCDAVMTLLQPWMEQDHDTTVMALLVGVEVTAWIEQENARRMFGEDGVETITQKWAVIRSNAKEVGMAYAEARRPEGC